MPTIRTVATFQEGLRILERTEDFASIQELIFEMLSICPLEEAHLAKDAIAHVLRRKQATEIQISKAYPQAVEVLDRKYADLAKVLRNAKAHGVVIPPPVAAPKSPEAAPSPKNRAMAKIGANPMGAFNGFNPLMIVEWGVSPW